MVCEREALLNRVENGIRAVFPGIGKCAISDGEGCYPPDPGLSRTIEAIKYLKLDELLLEFEGGKLLIVKYEYGETMAAVYYEGDPPPPDLARLIQLVLARNVQRPSDKIFLPAARVEVLAGRWERRIAPVFGEGYAAKLVENSLKGKRRDGMVPEDIAEARAFISSALGDCLALDKVDK